ERIALLDVGELGSEPGAVAQRLPDLVFRLADDDPDAPDPGGHDGLDPVEEHRLVRDRDELLRPRVRERTQTGALAAGEDQALHVEKMIADGPSPVVIPSAARDLAADPPRLAPSRRRR